MSDDDWFDLIDEAELDGAVDQDFEPHHISLAEANALTGVDTQDRNTKQIESQFPGRPQIENRNEALKSAGQAVDRPSLTANYGSQVIRKITHHGSEAILSTPFTQEKASSYTPSKNLTPLQRINNVPYIVRPPPSKRIKLDGPGFDSEEDDHAKAQPDKSMNELMRDLEKAQQQIKSMNEELMLQKGEIAVVRRRLQHAENKELQLKKENEQELVKYSNKSREQQDKLVREIRDLTEKLRRTQTDAQIQHMENIVTASVHRSSLRRATKAFENGHLSTQPVMQRSTTTMGLPSVSSSSSLMITTPKHPSNHLGYTPQSRGALAQAAIPPTVTPKGGASTTKHPVAKQPQLNVSSASFFDNSFTVDDDDFLQSSPTSAGIDVKSQKEAEFFQSESHSDADENPESTSRSLNESCIPELNVENGMSFATDMANLDSILSIVLYLSIVDVSSSTNELIPAWLMLVNQGSPYGHEVKGMFQSLHNSLTEEPSTSTSLNQEDTRSSEASKANEDDHDPDRGDLHTPKRHVEQGQSLTRIRARYLSLAGSLMRIISLSVKNHNLQALLATTSLIHALVLSSEEFTEKLCDISIGSSQNHNSSMSIWVELLNWLAREIEDFSHMEHGPDDDEHVRKQYSLESQVLYLVLFILEAMHLNGNGNGSGAHISLLDHNEFFLSLCRLSQCRDFGIASSAVTQLSTLLNMQSDWGGHLRKDTFAKAADTLAQGLSRDSVSKRKDENHTQFEKSILSCLFAIIIQSGQLDVMYETKSMIANLVHVIYRDVMVIYYGYDDLDNEERVAHSQSKTGHPHESKSCEIIPPTLELSLLLVHTLISYNNDCAETLTARINASRCLDMFNMAISMIAYAPIPNEIMENNQEGVFTKIQNYAQEIFLSCATVDPDDMEPIWEEVQDHLVNEEDTEDFDREDSASLDMDVHMNDDHMSD